MPLLQTSEYKTGFTPETFYGFSSILPQPMSLYKSVKVLWKARAVLCLVSACGKMTLGVHLAFYGDAVVKACVRPAHFSSHILFNFVWTSCAKAIGAWDFVLCKDDSWSAFGLLWRRRRESLCEADTFFFSCNISFCMNIMCKGNWCFSCGKVTLQVHLSFYGDAVVKACVSPTAWHQTKGTSSC